MRHAADAMANGAEAVERFEVPRLRCPRTEAIAVVTVLLNARVRQVERIAADQIDPLCARLELDAAGRERADRKVAALARMPAGDHEWGRRTGRYAAGRHWRLPARPPRFDRAPAMSSGQPANGGST